MAILRSSRRAVRRGRASTGEARPSTSRTLRRRVMTATTGIGKSPAWTPLHIAFLFFAGIAGGVISSLAGGASVITFPALLATGLPPVVATASNLVALIPGNLSAGDYRPRAAAAARPRLRRPGRGLGAGRAGRRALLLVTPERVFEVLIPLLLGFATVLFAFAGRISAWLRARARGARRDGAHNWGTSIAWLLPVSVYGGYFGAGVGVLLLGVLSVGDRRRLSLRQRHQESGDRPQHASRRRCSSSCNGAVAWPQTLVMMAGCRSAACSARSSRASCRKRDARGAWSRSARC